MAAPSIAVVGGGINGAGIGWELTRRGYRVTLFEKREFGWATSSKTTKMIHGGLRYLEQGDVRLVRESLAERAYLLRHLPSLVHPLRLILPIYEDGPRPRWLVGAGLALYDRLGGRGAVPSHRWLDAGRVAAVAPINRTGLRGGFEFWDAQVDDRELVRTVIRAARRDGLDAREHSPVERLERGGTGWRVVVGNRHATFDAAVAVAGPWMNELLGGSGLGATCRLALVRGSHLILNRLVSETGFLLPSAGEHRVFFVLPWKGSTMVGTTEIAHDGPLDAVEASRDEIEYLIERYNGAFEASVSARDVASTFAGVRPLIASRAALNSLSREYHVESTEGLVKVFGGKMTTFLSLARHVGDRVDAIFGKTRVARPAVFWEDGEVVGC